MSLVLGAYNEKDIVVAWDSLSTYKDPFTGAAFSPPDEMDKVQKINDKLAIMITGDYWSDKIQFIREFVSSNKNEFDLESAFKKLTSLAQATMTIHSGEQFGIGLAGFHNGTPAFHQIGTMNGQPIKDIEWPQNINCYVSGIEEAATLAQTRIIEKRILNKPPTSDIRKALRAIIREGIQNFTKLGSPARTLVIHGSR
jgi:hypothetical protein